MPLAASRRIPPVSTDQTGQLLEETAPKESAIENELPTYRAISNRAVFSVICGALAAFSFAQMYFLIFAVLAIVLGLLANVTIRRHPDLLTGRRLANAGIAMGLIFGLAVITFTTVHNLILAREIASFAQVYAKVLKEGTLGDVLLYHEPPDVRKSKTAQSVEEDFEKQKARDRAMAEFRMAPLLDLRKALARKNTRLHFVDVEGHGVDDSLVGRVHYYAAVLYEVEYIAANPEKTSKQFALAVFKGGAKGRHYEWWVDQVMFPYQPKTYKGSAKPIDDGHGHAPGAH
jgi:Domain of unknown function (DUF4190)